MQRAQIAQRYGKSGLCQLAKGQLEPGIKTVQAFLLDLNQIDDATASVSPVEFKMGSVVFKGFVRLFRWTATRFDPKGEPLSARLDLELVSDGSYESGGKK